MARAFVAKHVTTPTTMMFSIKQAEWFLACLANINVIVGLPIHGR